MRADILRGRVADYMGTPRPSSVGLEEQGFSIIEPNTDPCATCGHLEGNAKHLECEECGEPSDA